MKKIVINNIAIVLWCLASPVHATISETAILTLAGTGSVTALANHPDDEFHLPLIGMYIS